jgi:hypothetical protein
VSPYLTTRNRPRARYLAPIPPADVWYQYDGQEWATNAHVAITRGSPPLPGMTHPWLTVCADHRARQDALGRRAPALFMAPGHFTGAINEHILRERQLPTPSDAYDLRYAPLLSVPDAVVRTNKGFAVVLRPDGSVSAIVAPYHRDIRPGQTCNAFGVAHE